MERILIREDPKVFLRKLEVQKEQDELAKYGKRPQEQQSLVELNHPNTYFEAKPYLLNEEKVKNKQREFEQQSFKYRIRQKISYPINLRQNKCKSQQS